MQAKNKTKIEPPINKRKIKKHIKPAKAAQGHYLSRRIRNLVVEIENKKAEIAKKRDELRDTYSELQDIVESLEDADQELETAMRHFLSALDTMSSYL
jgi:SMC interacting uncharacterized protein involved in chromosome segregation